MFKFHITFVFIYVAAVIAMLVFTFPVLPEGQYQFMPIMSGLVVVFVGCIHSFTTEVVKGGIYLINKYKKK